MKFKSLLILLLSLLLNIAIAATNTAAITNLLAQTIPATNSETIIAKVDALSPQVKKEAFPVNERKLKNLTNYTGDAVKNSSFKKAYLKLINTLPQDVHGNNKWINNLANATTTPTEYLSTPAGKLVSLSACKPHDCPTNIKLLYNPEKKMVWGLLHVDDAKKSYMMGNPSDEQIALLLIAIGDEVGNY